MEINRRKSHEVQHQSFSRLIFYHPYIHHFIRTAKLTSVVEIFLLLSWLRMVTKKRNGGGEGVDS